MYRDRFVVFFIWSLRILTITTPQKVFENGNRQIKEVKPIESR